MQKLFERIQNIEDDLDPKKQVKYSMYWVMFSQAATGKNVAGHVCSQPDGKVIKIV